MKKIFKFVSLLIVMYVGIWFTLSGTGVGLKTLQVAAQQNNGSLAKVFMVMGANPKSKAEDGMTALHFAGYLGGDKTIPAMINEGARVNEQDKDGRTALHLAAYAGQVSAVKTLLENGADPELKETTNGMTALHLAVVQKNEEVIRAMLAKGVEVNPRDNNGYTPMFIAENDDLEAIVALLEENGGR